MSKTIIALVAAAMLLFLVLPASAAVVGRNINGGATVFIGEENLDITKAMNGDNTIGWWASAASITTTAPTTSLTVTALMTTFSVSPATFVGYTGNWYRINGAGAVNGSAFNVMDPQLNLQIWDPIQGIAINGQSVPQGMDVSFKIETNMYQVTTGQRSPINPATDGFITIKVKTPDGATYTELVNKSGKGNLLSNQYVNTQPFFWSTNGVANRWDTGAASTSQRMYPPGTYSVYAESTLNNMKNNYKNGGADYTGKTISEIKTVTLASDTIKITADKGTVVRSKPFSVTVIGKPSAVYYLWVKGTSQMSGGFDNTPPSIMAFQEGVAIGDPAAGAYVFENSGGRTISQDVPAVDNGIYFAAITTSTSGARTIEWLTNNQTKAQKYTIRVEQRFGGQVKSDQVDVKVEKGAVAIVASGDQSYYLGEEIKFSGSNSESYITYLFIVGPNLPAQGAQIFSDDPRLYPVITGVPATFQQASVDGANAWEWKWGTSKIALDAGTYTIYAVSQPCDSQNLGNAAYGTVSVIIKKPFISATAAQSTVAKGDKIVILGTAVGNPFAVNIWILGKNYATVTSDSVNSDSTFTYEVKGETTKRLSSGQYFVVVQHPMENGQFDIVYNPATGEITNKMLGTTGTTIFKLTGAGSLQGSDAAEALIQAINDPNVDDTYTKLQFLVEEPLIQINAIGDKKIGDKFTITAKTNLAVDDVVLVEVYSSSFKPTQKSQSGEFSGATGSVKVTKGVNSGMNLISFDVDAATFKPDEYIVVANAVIQEATGSALFNVLDAAAIAAQATTTPAPTPTKAPTPAMTPPPQPPTPIATPIPPTPTPTPTPASPGPGALVALAGILGVAFVVVRRP
jgi:hypothetical protein